MWGWEIRAPRNTHQDPLLSFNANIYIPNKGAWAPRAAIYTGSETEQPAPLPPGDAHAYPPRG